MKKAPVSDSTYPQYIISVVSELTKVTPIMIREYEKAGLILPTRVRGKRRFSPADLDNIKLIRLYLKDRGMTIRGLKAHLQSAYCFQFKMCRETKCPNFGANSDRCWELVSRDRGCDSSLCPTCPLYLAKSRNGKAKIAPFQIVRAYTAAKE